MTSHARKKTRVALLCACQCGKPVPQLPGAGRQRRWIPEHKPNQRRVDTAGRVCICGCGMPTVRLSKTGRWPSYFPGHAPYQKKPGHKPRVKQESWDDIILGKKDKK